jgi:hypothetical protein
MLQSVRGRSCTIAFTPIARDTPERTSAGKTESSSSPTTEHVRRIAKFETRIDLLLSGGAYDNLPYVCAGGLMTEDRERVLCRGEPLKEAVVEGAEIKVRSWTVQVTDQVLVRIGYLMLCCWRSPMAAISR